MVSLNCRLSNVGVLDTPWQLCTAQAFYLYMYTNSTAASITIHATVNTFNAMYDCDSLNGRCPNNNPWFASPPHQPGQPATKNNHEKPQRQLQEWMEVFFDQSTVRDLLARNVVSSLPWYSALYRGACLLDGKWQLVSETLGCIHVASSRYAHLHALLALLRRGELEVQKN